MHTTNCKVIHGKLIFSSIQHSIRMALTDPQTIQMWLADKLENDTVENTYSVFGNLPNNWNSMKLTITTKSNKIIWKSEFSNLTIDISFSLKGKIVYFTLACPQLCIYNFISDWLVSLYQLKGYIELGESKFPFLEFDQPNDFSSIVLTMPISQQPSKIFPFLTDKREMSKLFSSYPDFDPRYSHISWGWVDEGPANLITYDPDRLLIHDFIVDFVPIGIIKWEVSSSNDMEESMLKLSHYEMVLDGELYPERAYSSYRNGWLLYLYKLKDLAEHQNLQIIVDEKIID